MRTDGIGDFIQWLPCARKIADYYKKQNYEISLLGNTAWLSYAKSLNLFDNYADFNRKNYAANINYKESLVANLNKECFDIIINTSASREFAFGDSLMRLLNSKEKIGYKGDNSNDARFWLHLGEKWYSKMIDITDEEKYEPYLNTLLLKNLNIKLPEENIPLITSVDSESNFLNGDYFVIIPGSNMSLKQWDFKNFVTIASQIIDQTGFYCVFCGGEKESTILSENKKLILFEFENQINKTSLAELTSLISKAKFILSNDTGAVHIAAGVNIPAYVVFGGGHFGRFLPYKNEKTISRILPTVIYNKMECFNCNWKCKYQITKNKPAKCIESISIEQVWKEIAKGIKSDFKN